MVLFPLVFVVSDRITFDLEAETLSFIKFCCFLMIFAVHFEKQFGNLPRQCRWIIFSVCVTIHNNCYRREIGFPHEQKWLMWKNISCPDWKQWMGIWHTSYFVVFDMFVSKFVCVYLYAHFIEIPESINGTIDAKFSFMVTGKCDHT